MELQLKTNKILLVTLSVHHFLSERLANILKENNIPNVLYQNARSSMLKRRFLIPGYSVTNERLVVYKFYIDPKEELFVLRDLILSLELYTPGNGSIYTEEITLVGSNDFSYKYKHDADSNVSDLQRGLMHDLEVLNCIVCRGDAEKIVQLLISQGYLSPVITYGVGIGLRKHLGLIRIAIPPEKELFQVVVHEKDADIVDSYIRRVGKFHLPGRGFIFRHPIHLAKLNTRTLMGEPHHLASMDQIINAIDEVKGHSDWRRKKTDNKKQASIIDFFKKKQNASDVLLLNFITEEKDLGVITNFAFALGASGATCSRYRKMIYINNSIASVEKISVSMVFDREKTRQLVSDLTSEGYFERGGLLEYQSVFFN